MTLNEAITMADDIKPNSFSTATKVAWINSIEGRIASAVMLMAPEEVQELHYTTDDLSKTLLVDPPYDDIYVLWLCTKIDAANGEFDRYQDSLQIYNDHFSSFANWFLSTYDPVQGELREPGTDPMYYLSAYGLAVKHGYEGTEEEWLESLKGDTGTQGPMGRYISTVRMSELGDLWIMVVDPATHVSTDYNVGHVKGDTGATGAPGPNTVTSSTTTNLNGVLAGNGSVIGTVSVVMASEKGAASGVADLDSNGKVPSSQLPSYVDDVLEYNSQSAFPATGETGKIYVALDTNLTYRWSGSAYVEISPSLALGETSSTAYRGDRGKTAYDHSQVTSGNPHNVTAADLSAVSYLEQSLTSAQKTQARNNIGAARAILEPLTVTLTISANEPYYYTADKTVTEFIAAIAKGQVVIFKLDNNNYMVCTSIKLSEKTISAVGVIYQNNKAYLSTLTLNFEYTFDTSPYYLKTYPLELDSVPTASSGNAVSSGGVYSELAILAKIAEGTYEGVDLTVRFGSEIAASPYSGDPWAWIQARVTAGDFSGIHVFDWIPFTANNKSYNAEVMGINTYKGYGDTPIGSHIDFCTRELWAETHAINKVAYNNGVPAFTPTGGTEQAAVDWPWLASDMYHWLNSKTGYVPNSASVTPDMVAVDYTSGGVYYYLPAELKAVISEKRLFLTKRVASSSSLATADTGYGWTDIGRIWLPTEIEIFGYGSWGGYSSYVTGTGAVKYPYFNAAHRIKERNGSAAGWRTLSQRNGNANQWTFVSDNGYSGTYSLTSAYSIPICFRIAASE